MTNLQGLVFDYIQGSKKNPYLELSIYKTVEDLALSTLEYHRTGKTQDFRHVWEVRNEIALHSAEFLKKVERIRSGLGAFDKAQKMIEYLRDSEPKRTIILMTAHQPNLFAYSGVLKKIALISSLSKIIGSLRRDSEQLRFVCFFGVADHDFANNKWVRSAEIPSPSRRDGLLRYNVKIDRKQSSLPLHSIPRPSETVLNHWKDQTLSWIQESASLAGRQIRTSHDLKEKSPEFVAKESFSRFWELVEKVWKHSTSLADFSSILMSLISFEMFDEPILFADYSKCFSCFGQEFIWLAKNHSEFSKVVEKNETDLRSQGIDSGLSEDSEKPSPLWMKCNCGSKRKLIFSENLVLARCLGCRDEVSMKTLDLIRQIEDRPDLFEPRSISMPIVFSRGFGMDCYVGGIGGLGYLVHSRAVSNYLSSPFPPTPIWYTPDFSVTLENLSLLSHIKRIKKDYQLELQEFSEVQDMQKVAREMAGKLRDRISSSLISKNSVADRDLQLLDKIALYEDSFPNMIDIAANFTFKSIAEQWMDQLENDGRLQVPLTIKSFWNN